MIGRIWINCRIQLSENLQRVDEFLLTAQNRFQRFDKGASNVPKLKSVLALAKIENWSI